MAVIEHRTLDGVVGAYENSGATKFAIWHMTTPVMVYDGDDQTEALHKLEEWLRFIDEGGTAAIYTLKVYPDSATNITNKTPFRAATRFQLSADTGAEYKQTPDGRVMVIRQNQAPAVSGNNAQIQALLDNQNKLMDLMVKNMQQKEADKLDRLIGYLEESTRRPPEETTEDKLMKLGQFLIEKPDIIDRVGYIFRPSLYSREPVQEPINGTQQQEQPAPAQQKQEDPTMEQQQAQATELTEQQELALTDRQNAALDKMEDVVGLQVITEGLEKLSAIPDDKLQKFFALLQNEAKLKSVLTFL